MKSKFLNWTSVVASFLAVLFFSTLVNAQATSTVSGASVTGTVTFDGQPVVNAKVMVYPAHKGKKAVASTDSTGTAPGGKKHRPDPLMKVTTDGNGQFTLNDLPAGDYVIIAAEKGQGRGHQKLNVTDGQSQTVTITLKARKAGSKKGAAIN